MNRKLSSRFRSTVLSASCSTLAKLCYLKSLMREIPAIQTEDAGLFIVVGVHNHPKTKQFASKILLVLVFSIGWRCFFCISGLVTAHPIKLTQSQFALPTKPTPSPPLDPPTRLSTPSSGAASERSLRDPCLASAVAYQSSTVPDERPHPA